MGIGIIAITILILLASLTGSMLIIRAAQEYGFKSASTFAVLIGVASGQLANVYIQGSLKEFGWSKYGPEHIFFIVVGFGLGLLVASYISVFASLAIHSSRSIRKTKYNELSLRQTVSTIRPVSDDERHSTIEGLMLRLSRLRDHGFNENAQPGLDEPATLFLFMRLHELGELSQTGIPAEKEYVRATVYVFDRLISEMETRNGMK